MTTDVVPLAKLFDEKLSSITLSQSGDWMIFRTTDNKEFKFCCNSLVLVDSESYWRNYAIGGHMGELKSYNLTAT